jgi:hypothetical protein
MRLNSIDRCSDPERLVLACIIAHQEHGLARQVETILMHLHDALFGMLMNGLAGRQIVEPMTAYMERFELLIKTIAGYAPKS